MYHTIMGLVATYFNLDNAVSLKNVVDQLYCALVPKVKCEHLSSPDRVW